MDIVDEDIERYITEHTSPESETLQQVVRDTKKDLDYVDMISGNQVGQLLKLLVRVGRCKRILEVGTFTGYSAISMADALPDDGELITLEMNERYQSISGKYFSQEPYAQKIRQMVGPALESIENIEGEFDLIFIDADKAQYTDYYWKLKPMLKKGGMLVIDNVLWGGSVLNPDDLKSRVVDELNKLVQNDPDFENMILPVRDGIMAAFKL